MISLSRNNRRITARPHSLPLANELYASRPDVSRILHNRTLPREMAVTPSPRVALDFARITSSDIFFSSFTLFACFAIQHVSQRALASRAKWFAALDASARADIGVRCASALWGTIAGVLATVIIVPAIARGTTPSERVYAPMTYARELCCAASGYFIWDLSVSLKYYDKQYVTHAAASIVTFAMPALMPGSFLHYYGLMFILWEITLPLLAVRTIMIKSGRGSTVGFQVVQALGFGLFIFLRFILGLPVMYTYVMDAYEMYTRGLATPKFVYAFYVVGGGMFQLLNCLWVFEMVKVLLRPKKKRATD